MRFPIAYGIAVGGALCTLIAVLGLIIWPFAIGLAIGWLLLEVIA